MKGSLFAVCIATILLSGCKTSQNSSESLAQNSSDCLQNPESGATLVRRDGEQFLLELAAPEIGPQPVQLRRSSPDKQRLACLGIAHNQMTGIHRTRVISTDTRNGMATARDCDGNEHLLLTDLLEVGGKIYDTRHGRAIFDKFSSKDCTL